jgi:hypothetical protein
MLRALSHQTEYTLYAYNYGNEKVLSEHSQWTKLMSSHDAVQITLQAKNLFKSKKYQKIEIKKKYFDKKKGRVQAATFKIFEDRQDGNYFIFVSMLLLGFAFAGLFYLQFL